MLKRKSGLKIVDKVTVFSALELCADSGGVCYWSTASAFRRRLHFVRHLKKPTAHGTRRFRFSVRTRGVEHRLTVDEQLVEVVSPAMVNDIKYIVNSFESIRVNVRISNANRES